MIYLMFRPVSTLQQTPVYSPNLRTPCVPDKMQVAAVGVTENAEVDLEREGYPGQGEGHQGQANDVDLRRR